MRRPSSAWRRRGLTLVEAVAGIALLGTLLTAMVVAHVRMLRQARRAELRLDGAAIADQLLAGWWADLGKRAPDGQGAVKGRPGWTWRTQSRENPAATAFGARVVNLAVFGPGQPRGRPVLELEVLVPRASAK